MPIYAQIICIGGNGLFALLFALAGFGAAASGDTGLAVFLFLLTGAAGYSAWVLLKFRRYLGAEQALEREAHIADLRRQLDAANARPADGAATAESGGAAEKM